MILRSLGVVVIPMFVHGLHVMHALHALHAMQALHALHVLHAILFARLGLDQDREDQARAPK